MMLKFLNPTALSLFTTDAETLTMMWQTVVLGMGMVFSVLALLFGILSIFKLVFAGKTPKAPKEKKPTAAEKKTAVTSSSAPDDAIAAVIAAGVQAIREDENQQLVAVITAAVSAYRAAEGENGSFRVVSFKRAGSARAWNARK
jgi:sodium pump decarboxylase gamma subunit